MRVTDIQEIIERDPFRPFTVRLNNGAQYSFNTRREIGATQDYGMVFHFHEGGGAARIDTDSIVEIIESK